MKIDESLFDQTAFLAWLEAQPGGAILGHACAANDCPLVIYLRSLSLFAEIDSKGNAHVWTGPEFYQNTAYIALPQWARWLVIHVDMLERQALCSREFLIETVKGIVCKKKESKKRPRKSKKK